MLSDIDFSLVALFGIGFTLVLAILAWFVLAAKFAQRIKAYSQKSSSQKNYQTVFGHKIFYTQEGSGPHLLLIHGIGASHYVWRFITPLLAKHFTVTAIDLLGFGKSDKPITFLYDLD